MMNYDCGPRQSCWPYFGWLGRLEFGLLRRMSLINDGKWTRLINLSDFMKGPYILYPKLLPHVGSNMELLNGFVLLKSDKSISSYCKNEYRDKISMILMRKIWVTIF